MSETLEHGNKTNGRGSALPVSGMKRMAAPRTGPAMSVPASSVDGGASRLQGKKMAEDKTRARTLARAQAVAEKLSTATEEVAAAINQATSTVEELGKTMQTIASGAEEAAAAAEESRAAINQIEKACDTANSLAGVSLGIVDVLYSLSRSTSADIEALIKGVSDAAQANFDSAKMIAELERQSEEIGKIVHAVARIADQTNLLALNAAIEAARAALYMSALSASRYDRHLAAFYRAPRARHKTGLQALMAVARKMLHAIYGIFKSSRPYDGRRLFPNIQTEVESSAG